MNEYLQIMNLVEALDDLELNNLIELCQAMLKRNEAARTYDEAVHRVGRLRLSACDPDDLEKKNVER